MALGAVAVMALLASPAGAQTTAVPTNLPAGSTALNGSVSSGTGYANQNSTASGDAVAINGSTGSGCADAVNNSTASGAPCPPAAPPAKPAAPATPTAARLALTGSGTVQMAGMAALALALGAGLVMASRRRAALQA